MTQLGDRIFEGAVRLPQLPNVVSDVIRSLNNEDVSLISLSNLVSNDQVISAKLLRLANSSYFGARRQVSSVSDAVKLVGLNSFRNLVIASGVVCAFPKIEGFDIRLFWKKSMLVANLSHILGREIKEDRDTLFTAGLLHSIGTLLVFMALPELARRATQEIEKVSLSEIREYERGIFELSHFEVGMELARRWNFPDGIQMAIGYYDNPQADNVPAQVVHAASVIASGILGGATFDDMYTAIPSEISSSLCVSKAWFSEHGEIFDSLLEQAANLQ